MQSDVAELNYSTAEFALANKVKPETVRARFYKFGSYFGAIPTRLPSGRLVWPAAKPNTAS